MIKEYERELSDADRKVLKKEIDFAKSFFPKTRRSVFLKIPVLIGFVFVAYYYLKWWLIILFSIISFFMIWMLIMEIKELIKLPKFLRDKSQVMESGVARVREFKIDRYIKINSYHDEGDHYIIEYDGRLVMVGGQEFEGVRKLKNRIEYIEILDSDRKNGYNTRVVKHGESLTPYYVFKNKLPEELINSDLWNNLTEQEPFAGKLEDLDPYIDKKSKK